MLSKITELSDVLSIDNINISVNSNNIDKLVLSDLWPRAVPEAIIARTDEQVRLRAKSIMRSYVGDIQGKKFLDFGCGLGHCVMEAQKTAETSIGYDIIANKLWDEFTVAEHQNFAYFTTDFAKVKWHAPYDYILLYDVIDHIERNTLESVVDSLNELITDKTIIKIRCHPWTSIHGGHMYETLNKAYAHLLLSDETIAKYQKEYCNKIDRPVMTYDKLFEKFKRIGYIVHRMHWNNSITNVIRDKSIMKLITDRVNGDPAWQEAVLPIEYIDFTLGKAC